MTTCSNSNAQNYYKANHTKLDPGPLKSPGSSDENRNTGLEEDKPNTVLNCRLVEAVNYGNCSGNFKFT